MRVPEKELQRPRLIRTAERPHRIDEQARARITVQVVDGKIRCDFTPAGRRPGVPEREA